MMTQKLWIGAGIVILALVMIIFLLLRKGQGKNEITEGETMAEFISISMEEAKKIFAESGDYVILDVRRADEFAEGHIPGAINVANESIGSEKPELLPDTEQTIYVYCRSGRRSKEAATKLAAMGYTHIIECGGIIDWTGDLEK